MLPLTIMVWWKFYFFNYCLHRAYLVIIAPHRHSMFFPLHTSNIILPITRIKSLTLLLSKSDAGSAYQRVIWKSN